MGRPVLVTGASRGIGAAIAREFAATGDRVAVHYGHARADAEEVLKSLAGGSHVVVGADIGDPAATQAMVDEAAAQLGGLEVLVNNAAVFVEREIVSSSYEQWRDAWEQIVRVDLLGTANVTWCAVRHMLERGTGRIVTVSSVAAYRGARRSPPYGAAKAGLVGLGNALAAALAPHGISVTTVVPGWTNTDMTSDARDAAQAETIRATMPFGRVAGPVDVAKAVVYLASPDAEFASGTTLHVNGASYLTF